MGTRPTSQSLPSCCRGGTVRDRGRGGSGQGIELHTIDSTATPSSMESTASPQLASLQRYASHQTGLIESLSSQGGFFHDTDPDDNWVKLWFTFWGKEGGWDTTRKVIRGFDPIDDFLLPHVVPAECDVMIKPGVVDNCWHLESESIFIRSEYKEAEEFAVSVCGAARRNMALMVAGQPGIGSSLSISPSLTQVLSSFIRKIHLSSPSALAPSYI